MAPIASPEKYEENNATMKHSEYAKFIMNNTNDTGIIDNSLEYHLCKINKQAIPIKN